MNLRFAESCHAILLTNFIAELSQLLQCKFVGVILQACLSVDCVEYEVRVYMVGIGVSCHYNFVTGEGSLRKLNSNPMSKCRLYLVAAWMRLYEMIILFAVSLAVNLPCVFELLIGSRQRTVESRHIFLFLSLIIAADVIETFLAAATALGAYRYDRCHHFTSFRS